MAQVNDEAWRQAIDRNYDVFVRQLGTLLADHAGEYALIHDAKILAFFPSGHDAEMEGQRRFGMNEPFSTQPVTREIVDMGYFSHAAY